MGCITNVNEYNMLSWKRPFYLSCTNLRYKSINITELARMTFGYKCHIFHTIKVYASAMFINQTKKTAHIHNDPVHRKGGGGGSKYKIFVFRLKHVYPSNGG